MTNPDVSILHESRQALIVSHNCKRDADVSADADRFAAAEAEALRHRISMSTSSNMFSWAFFAGIGCSRDVLCRSWKKNAFIENCVLMFNPKFDCSSIFSFTGAGTFPWSMDKEFDLKTVTLRHRIPMSTSSNMFSRAFFVGIGLLLTWFGHSLCRSYGLSLGLLKKMQQLQTRSDIRVINRMITCSASSIL